MADFPEQHSDWVALTAQPDKIMARMVATMLSANGIHARVSEVHGQICVEVQEHDFDYAIGIYDPGDSGISAPLQENHQATGIHTGARIREQLAARAAAKQAEPDPEGSNLFQWIIVLAMIAGAVAFFLWAFSD
ncbi:MAG: hypothetical protein ACYTDT_12170 [Planctomycetota bacterium]